LSHTSILFSFNHFSIWSHAFFPYWPHTASLLSTPPT
jgi:hypothetical protein